MLEHTPAANASPTGHGASLPREVTGEAVSHGASTAFCSEGSTDGTLPFRTDGCVADPRPEAELAILPGAMSTTFTLGPRVKGTAPRALEHSSAQRTTDEIAGETATEGLYAHVSLHWPLSLGTMVGEGSEFQALLNDVRVVAPTDATVLVLGETGTGKGLVARAIHDMSERRDRDFVKVDCSAIPAALLESELFGHEKGAFTGAQGLTIGRFERANYGTLFLDEIGEMPLELQSKLLRAVQEHEFERVGGNRTIRVDMRVIAATNRDLKAMIAAGTFRSDLYYRLAVFPIQVAPLRDRKWDIPLLIHYFTRKFAERMQRSIESIPTAAIRALTEYEWPGNIRELENVVERSVILTQGSVLHVVLPDPRSTPGIVPAPRSGPHSACERDRILHALNEAGGVVSGPDGAAMRLGLRRTTLQSRMKRLNISRRYR